MNGAEARSHPERPADRGAVVVTGIGTAVVAVTVAGGEGVLRSADPGTAFERSAPVVLLVLATLLAVGLASCWVGVYVMPRPAQAAALAVSAVTVAWWAGWTWLPDTVRALVLALPLLAVPAVSATATSWRGSADAHAPGGGRLVGWLAAAAALVHAVAYDPFEDVDCVRTCEGSGLLARTLGLGHLDVLLGLSSLLGLAAVGLAVVVALRQATAPGPVRGAVVLALVSLGTGLVHRGTVAGLPHDLLSVAAVTVLAITCGAACARLLARRRAADRLVRELRPADVPRELPEADLTPAQRLALTSARLEAEARRNLEETRAAHRQVIRLADDERTRIERDLHDGAQQLLVSAALRLSIAASGADDTVAAPLDRARARVLCALAELRRISHGPFPSVLEDEGLLAAVEELVADHGGRLTVVGDLHQVDTTTARAAYAALGETLSGSDPGAVVVLEGSDGVHLSVSWPDRSPGPLSTGTRDRLDACAARVVDGPREREVWVPCGS